MSKSQRAARSLCRRTDLNGSAAKATDGDAAGTLPPNGGKVKKAGAGRSWSAKKASTASGASLRQVLRAKWLKKQSPKTFAKVKAVERALEARHPRNLR